MTDREYLEKKRLEVLEMIKPYCEVFGIKDYDYEINKEGYGQETLRLNDIHIGCSFNSFSAIMDELIGYIFIKRYTRWLGHFSTQTKNVIKEYWVK